MKKFRKTVFSLSMILFYANSAYATTTGIYVASDSSSNSWKMFMLLVALGLVALVLFIGYKMDKNEAQEKRKEQIIKNNKNDDKENKYQSKMHVSELEKEDIEYIQNDEEYMRQYKKASEETAVLQPLTYNFEETEDDYYEETEEEFVATYEIHKENVENNIEVSDSTMVFDTTAIKDVEVEKEVEEKPKVAKKATTKKAANTKTTKSTTKKAATKTAKTTKKEAEEKPKVAKKATTKKAASAKTTKSTTKKAATKK